MIVLDTNVISEPMKLNGSTDVRAWLDRQVADSLYLTATSLSELLLGIELLPPGKRKDGLTVKLAELLSKLFGSRILPFDQHAALTYSRLIGHTRSIGHIISVADGQIAAIATAHGFTIATRDVEPFIAAGVPVINPWQACA